MRLIRVVAAGVRMIPCHCLNLRSRFCKRFGWFERNVCRHGRRSVPDAQKAGFGTKPMLYSDASLSRLGAQSVLNPTLQCLLTVGYVLMGTVRVEEAGVIMIRYTYPAFEPRSDIQTVGWRQANRPNARRRVIHWRERRRCCNQVDAIQQRLPPPNYKA